MTKGIIWGRKNREGKIRGRGRKLVRNQEVEGEKIIFEKVTHTENGETKKLTNQNLQKKTSKQKSLNKIRRGKA